MLTTRTQLRQARDNILREEARLRAGGSANYRLVARRRALNKMIALHGGDRPEWATKMTQTTNEYFYDLLSDEEKAKIKDTTDSDQARGLVMQSMRDRNRNLLQVALQLQQHLMAREAMDEPEEDDDEEEEEVCVLCQEPVLRSLRSTFRCENCRQPIHQECARKSFKNCPRCPTCRTWVFDMVKPKRVWASSTNYVPYYEGYGWDSRMIFGDVWFVVVKDSMVSPRDSGAREPNLPQDVISEISSIDDEIRRKRKRRRYIVSDASPQKSLEEKMFEVMTKNPVYVTLHGNRLEGFKIDEANWISIDGSESELEEFDSESNISYYLGQQGSLKHFDKGTVVVLANPLYNMESNFTVDPKFGLVRNSPKVLFVQTRADSTERWRTISTFVEQDDRIISPHPCSFRLQDDEFDLFGNLISMQLRSIRESGGFKETDWLTDLQRQVRIVELDMIESVDCSGVRNHEWDAAMGVFD